MYGASYSPYSLHLTSLQQSRLLKTLKTNLLPENNLNSTKVYEKRLKAGEAEVLPNSS